MRNLHTVWVPDSSNKVGLEKHVPGSIEKSNGIKTTRIIEQIEFRG